jgi:hypothetical protein
MLSMAELTVDVSTREVTGEATEMAVEAAVPEITAVLTLAVHAHGSQLK